MNVDDRNSPKSPGVKSKYFTETSAMDESLTYFKETKKSCTGPKITTNSKISKPKKASKRLRGQKDIRTALKSTKKELENYSKDFDKVCKKAGLDVDSEDLQLAIALSKSLQNTPSPSDSGETSQTPTSQGRIGKIRTTLQEYGFKIPEVKIAGNTRKGPRKLRKNFKLIYTSDTDKKEIIAEKYSQILFENISHCNLLYSEVETSNIPIYFLASNVPYNILKVSDTFYTNNLIEKSASNGNLLRDWTTIPCRPESPKLFEPMSMSFSEIECSQEELDVILSGTIKRCRDIMKNKIEDLKTCDNSKMDIVDTLAKSVTANIEENNTNAIDEIDKPILSENKCRSYSPDMFDEDASDIFEETKNDTVEIDIKSTQTPKNKSYVEIMDLIHSANENSPPGLNTNTDISKRKSNDLMELTECITMSKNKGIIVDETLSQFSQNTNVTKRKSSDIMEITKCVANSSQASSKTHILNNIDLTQSLEILEDNDITDVMDTGKDRAILLTCNATNLTEKPEINALNLIDTGHTGKTTDIQSMDLTQSSNTSDELPFVSLNYSKDESLGDTIIVDINDYANINKRTTLQTDEEVHIDLTQDVYKNTEASVHSQNFFEEYNHEHSEGTEEEREISSKVSEENVSELNRTKSPRKRIRNNYNLATKDNNSSPLSQPITDASQIVVETIPGEIHPAYSGYRYPKPRNLEHIDENCFIVEEHRTDSHDGSELKDNFDDVETTPFELDPANSGNRYSEPSNIDHAIENSNENCPIVDEHRIDTDKIQDRSDNICKLQENLHDVDLTQRSDESENIRQADKVSTPNKNNGSDRTNNISILQDPIDDIDLTQQSDTSDLSQASNVTIPYNSKENNEQLNQISSIDSPDISSHQENSYEDVTEKNNSPTFRSAQICSSFGKKDDMSIDYDEIINMDKNNSNNKSVSIVIENPDDSNNGKKSFSRNNSMISNCSQHSEVFDLTDKELDYSLHQSRLEIPKDNFEFGGISIMDDLSNLGNSKKSIQTNHSYKTNHEDENETESFPKVTELNRKEVSRCNEISPIKHRRITEIATPQKPCSSDIVTVTTPKNSELIIKTNNVTPITNYEAMSTPEIHKELDKYGIKPFKRKRAIQLLTHIYNQTHPIIDNADELASPPKRHKPNHYLSSPKKRISPRKLITSPRKDIENYKDEASNNIVKENLSKKTTENGIIKNKGKGKGKKSRVNQKDNVENSTNTGDIRISQNNQDSKEKGGLDKRQREKENDNIPVMNEIECEDWVFQKREKAKVHSCRVPLHIAFYNYVCSRRDLREAILCYEPVEIDLIHKDLVAYGHRYDPKDLLKFLDKKCITVKTTDNDGRNQKR